ncbi:hypothetical protein NQZ68_017881 [Dissostichus eleginoides]|nr:hypothetical protein NQZ68_017881 [Dissostichus eleginoides]
MEAITAVSNHNIPGSFPELTDFTSTFADSFMRRARHKSEPNPAVVYYSLIDRSFAVSLPGLLLTPGCGFGPRTKPPQRLGGEVKVDVEFRTRPSFAIPHPASPSYSHVRADIHWHTYTQPPLSPPLPLAAPVGPASAPDTARVAAVESGKCSSRPIRHSEQLGGRENDVSALIKELRRRKERRLRNPHHVYSSYSINGVGTCARLSEAHRKVKYVCVYVLSEAECLALQSKYRLITPSDLGNEKWNSGFPAGLWARLS